MMIKKTKFKDLMIISSNKHKDKRGFFKGIYKDNIIKKKFVFDCFSYSKKNVLRGLHFQKKNPQGKFLTVIDGKIFDVSVDLRKKSPSFGKYFSIILYDKKDLSIFVPPGFAHGFLCLSNTCKVYYKCTQHRDANSEESLHWNDEYLNIKWPIKKPITSHKDKKAKKFIDLNI